MDILCLYVKLEEGINTEVILWLRSISFHPVSNEMLKQKRYHVVICHGPFRSLIYTVKHRILLLQT